MTVTLLKRCIAGITLCFFLAPAVILVSTTPAFGQLTSEDIAALRERAKEEGWTFRISENSATRRPLHQLCGSYLPPDWEPPALQKAMEPLAYDLPTKFDWRNYRAFPPVRDQGGCGSCWAFATVGVLECAIALTDDVIEDLSEEWLVRCNTDGWDCVYGGFAAHDYHLGVKTDPCGGSGAVYEADYPYTATDGFCDCPFTHQYLIQDWGYASSGVPYIKRAILQYGPVYVSVYAEDAFQAYGGGVFNACVNDQGTNHAVVLLGWDDTQGEYGAWIMRNSWGTGWGEDDGYMRIEYGCSNVGRNPSYIDYNGEFGPPILACGAYVFDDSEGNADGRADPGETNVELIIPVSNCGVAVTNLTMQVSTIDPEIIFSDDESSYGNLDRWDQVYNDTDPIVFSVDPGFPPTIVKFVLSFTGDGGFTHVETLTVDVGPPQVMVIDDDEAVHLEYEDYFTNILDSLRTPHTIWGKDTLLSPPSDTLDEYPIVLWITGDARSDVLSTDDVSNLRDFLDAGGRLLLTGQDIAQDLSDDADSTFMIDYLHVRYTPGVPQLLAFGVADDPISQGHILPLGGPGGAANQTSPDKLAPVDGVAKVCYTYYGGGDAGVRVASGDYKAVFLGFGMESIANGLPGYTKREVALISMFDWLLDEGPDYIPGDLNDDDAVDPLDVSYMVAYVYLSSDPPPNGLNSADVNGDCAVDPLDVSFIVWFVYMSRGELVPGCVE